MCNAFRIHRSTVLLVFGNNPSPNSQSASSAARDGGQFADYADRNNTLFQNLLANASVRDVVVTHEDGTYSFIGKGALSQQQWLARQLIIEQNDFIHPDPNIQTPYSPSELQLYRELTGYNLIQAGGAFTVLDDYGNSVPEADLAMVDAAWRMFDHAKGIQDVIGGSGDLTLDELMGAADALRSQAIAAHTDETAFDVLLKKLSEKRAAAAPDNPPDVTA